MTAWRAWEPLHRPSSRGAGDRGMDRHWGEGLKGEALNMVIGGLIVVFLELLFLMSEKESAEVENMTESRILGARMSAEVHYWFCNSKKCGRNLVFINRTCAL